MFRIGLKFPCSGLSRVKRHGYSRFHLLIRNHETRARIKTEQKQRFPRDAKLLSIFSRARYSVNAPEGTPKQRGIGITPLIVIAVGISGSLLTYAKYDPQFRAILEEYVPGIDRVLRLMFLEDLLDSNNDESSKNLKGGLNIISGSGSKERSGQIGQATLAEVSKSIPSKPISTPLLDKKEKKEQPHNEPSMEIHVSKSERKSQSLVDTKSSEAATPASSSVVSEKPFPASVTELERECGLAAAKVATMYEDATRVNEDYNRYVTNILGSTTIPGDKLLWQKLKETTEQRKKLQSELTKQSSEALDSLNKLSALIEEKRFETSPNVMNRASGNVKKMVESVHAARSKYENSAKTGNITEQYWQQVKAARDAFNQELRILFPHIDLEDKMLQGSNEAFDLFVYYMYNKVTYLQKELEKIKTLDEMKLQSALRGSGDTATQERLNALVDLQVASKMRSLQEDFEKQMLEQEKIYTDDLRQKLKLQLELHTDHLRESLAAKEREHQRELSRAVSEQTVSDQTQHNMKMATIVGRLRALEKTLKGVLEEERKATNLQILWSSCQALVRALKHGPPPGASPDETIKPLEPMIKAISKAAPKDDPLVLAAIESIPELATTRGVYPESTLRQRFLKVEKVAKKLAMVPAEGASLPIYFLSYLQSILVINSGYAISKCELQDAPVDVESLNTYEILNRARYWIDQGDFKMCLRYMNLLKGAPRSIARDWMNEVRVLLETQQAVSIFNAYAGALGLTFINATSQKTTDSK